MFAALHLPDLAVVAALRLSPSSQGRPCAVLEVDPSAVVEKVKLPLLAVNDAARGTGIDAGWPLNRALVRCPDLRILAPHPPGEEALMLEMVAAAESLTPDLEITSKDTLLLDLSRATSRQAARLAHLELTGGFLRHVRAATPDLARLAVRCPPLHGKFVSPVEIQVLPLTLLGSLPGGSGKLKLLADWGLRSLGDLMALPRQDLIERLGHDAGEWHDLLHGKSCRLLRLHRPPENLEQTADFEEPTANTEPLVFTFKRLLHALTARLAARHVAVQELRLGFHLESGAVLERTIRFPEPRVEEGELLRPVQVLLDSLKPERAVTGVTLDATTTAPSVAQRDWFVRQLPRPERWTDTLAQLEALVGLGNVGIPAPPNSHRPEDFQIHPAELPLPSGQCDHVPEWSIPLRRFRPPHEVSVAFDVGPRPLALLTGPYRGEIMSRRGPFKRSGAWWDPEQAWKRLEWDVELASHHLLRLAFQPPDRWLIDGLYG